jgi:hypothetical protein
MDVKVMEACRGPGQRHRKDHGQWKDSRGTFAWMDVFMKRDGKWVAVRSQTAMAK